MVIERAADTLVCILLGAIIVGVIVALITLVGTAVWANHAPKEKEPWERQRAQFEPRQTADNSDLRAEQKQAMEAASREDLE